MISEGNLKYSLSQWALWLPYLLFGFLIISFVAIAIAAPAERTLGEAIRYVYVHVALTKAGMWGIYLAGLLGIAITFSGKEKLQYWAQIIAWTGFSFFVAGGIVSVFAGYATWGGFPLDEPRNNAMFTTIALGLIVLILNHWLPIIRLRGLLYALFAGYIIWLIPNTPLVLHPGNAGGSSPSPVIRWVFILLPLTAFLMEAWIVWFWGSRSKVNRPKPVPPY